MKRVKIRYFAVLRDQAKSTSETLELAGGTYGDLYTLLKEKHGFTLPIEMIQVAVNDEFRQLESEVSDGANIVFIPPVAGG